MSDRYRDLYEDTLDRLIAYAGSNVADRIFDEIDASIPDDEINFSEGHIKAINNIIANEKNKINKNKKLNKRIFLAVAVIVAMLFAFAMTVSGYREKIVNFITEKTPFATNFYFESDDELVSKISIKINYIPENFESSQEYKNENDFFERYVYEDSYFDIQKQIVPDTYSINTEDAEIKRVDINGCEAIVSISDKIKIITWIKDGCIITVSGNIDEDSLMKIALNID